MVLSALQFRLRLNNRPHPVLKLISVRLMFQSNICISIDDGLPKTLRLCYQQVLISE